MELEIFCQLLLATFLGAIIGLEREVKRKEAGLQTYSLVALGTCLFTIVSFSLAKLLINFDPSPILIAIGVGMGFIGAGTIFRGEGKIEGLTTAAGLWVTAAIGLAIGTQFYFLAITATLLVLLIFVVLGFLEGKIFKKEPKEIK